MEDFIVFMTAVLLCITVNMTNAQGEVTLQLNHIQATYNNYHSAL